MRLLLPTWGMWGHLYRFFLIRPTPAFATPIVPPAEGQNMTGDIEHVNPEHEDGHRLRGGLSGES